MCDAVPGELVVCYHAADTAAVAVVEQIMRQQVPHVTLIESVGDRLHAVGVKPRSNPTFHYFRLGVPAGEEEFKINVLHFLYRHEVGRRSWDPKRNPDHAAILGNSSYAFQVSRNSILSVAQGGGPSGVAFTFDPIHGTYLRMVGWRRNSGRGFGRRVLTLDTGVDPATPFNVSDRKNFVDPTTPSNVDDDHGHGTAVASIIHDLAPSADLVVYKVADRHGRATEWDTIAAMAADSQADVVNISLAFGLQDVVCNVCGRQSHASRSAVFEAMVRQLQAPSSPVVVAAAGNEGKPELLYPARFGTLLAVMACDSTGAISAFSNRGTTDHEGNAHPNVFVLPGGKRQGTAPATEAVGSSANGMRHAGTSFAAAYASGLVAAVWSGRVTRRVRPPYFSIT